MTKLRIAACLAAAFSLPSFAGPTPPVDPWADLDFSYTFDIDDMVAQATPPAPPPPPDARQWREYGEKMREWAEEFSTELQGNLAIAYSDRVGRGKVVKGAPYSAEAVSERRQMLYDGNVISHESRSRVFRDGEGRTRQETLRNGEVRSVFISDPVAGVTYTLLPKNKVAVVSTRHAERDRDRERDRERDRTSERGVTVERDKKVIVADNGTREEVRVRVIRGDDEKDLPAPPTPPIPPLPPMPSIDYEVLPQVAPLPGTYTMNFETPPASGQSVTKKLGAKDIEGVKAEGTQTVWTIPAGKIGNKNPIDVTRETWTSPDLHVTVYSRYADPRAGESIYRLAAIKRAEPAADLFKLPDGYKVKERHGHAAPIPPMPPVPPAPGAHPAPPAPPAPPPRG
jgi:hypothetical protein